MTLLFFFLANDPIHISPSTHFEMEQGVERYLSLYQKRGTEGMRDHLMKLFLLLQRPLHFIPIDPPLPHSSDAITPRELAPSFFYALLCSRSLLEVEPPSILSHNSTLS